MKPKYEILHEWENYAGNLKTEYAQCMDEGLDVEAYKGLFDEVRKLPDGEIKKKFADVIFDLVNTLPMRDNYPYNEPSTLDEIRALRKPFTYQKTTDLPAMERIMGAWIGRICGCLLGKTVEGISIGELATFLKKTDNYPMHRYIRRSDINDETICGMKYNMLDRPYIDEVDGMPWDDDTNYTVLYQTLIELYGRDFTPFDVSRLWMSHQPKAAYCTAERVAFCNFVAGFVPPDSAVYQNAYREWIGAQIRADYFGYINPGNPELAAEMAWRDASISHVKNGIYGEMFVAAMLAAAAETDNIEDIIRAGLAEIPATSRLYAEVGEIILMYHSGAEKDDVIKHIHGKYDEFFGHGWCHTNSNAMVVATALLYGKGDYEKSICMAVQAGFDTDCNGATVGSILGMALGEQKIPEIWKSQIHDTLYTTIFEKGKLKISECAELTLKHMK